MEYRYGVQICWYDFMADVDSKRSTMNLSKNIIPEDSTSA